MGQCSSAPTSPAWGGLTAMHSAAASGDIPRILAISAQEEKCGRRLSVGSTDRNASTPLHHAAYAGQLASVRALISLGANQRAANGRGFLPLHLAAMQGHAAVVRCLLVADPATARAQDKDGWTPLMCAARNGHSECIRLLAQAGRNLEARSSGGSTALLIAASSLQDKSVLTLLGLGADPAAANSEGFTALHLAAQHTPGSPQAARALFILRCLLEKGAPVDARAQGSTCALHLAAAAGSVDAVQLLLSFRADQFALDDGGRSPLQLAVERGRHGVVELLLPLEYPPPAVSAAAGKSCPAHAAAGAAGEGEGGSDLCCICLDAPRQMAAVPCGHRAMCETCSQVTLKAGGEPAKRTCPICRASIMALLRVYDA